MRKSASSEFMDKVVEVAIKQEKAIAQLPSKYEVHQTQIVNWSKHDLEGTENLFKEENKEKGNLWKICIVR